MNAFKIVLLLTLTFVVPESYCSPITREMEQESIPENNIQQRLTTDRRCRQVVVVHCIFLTRDFNAKHKLKQYQKCLTDGFEQNCG